MSGPSSHSTTQCSHQVWPTHVHCRHRAPAGQRADRSSHVVDSSGQLVDVEVKSPVLTAEVYVVHSASWPSLSVSWLHCRRLDHTHTHTHTHTHLTVLFPGLPRWAGTRKVKPARILLKQDTVSGSGISWAMRTSAPRSRQTTTPAPHHSVFTGRMPFLPPNQQRQSTEGNAYN